MFIGTVCDGLVKCLGEAYRYDMTIKTIIRRSKLIVKVCIQIIEVEKRLRCEFIQNASRCHIGRVRDGIHGIRANLVASSIVDTGHSH